MRLNRNFARLLCLLVVAAIAALAPAAAEGAYSHSVVEGSFSTNGCKQVIDIAVDEHNGYLYVSCAFDWPQTPQIKRYHLDGTPANFSASKPYISGNALTGDPGSPEGTFGINFGSTQIAIDNSSSPNQGRLFVANSPNVDVFNPSGAFFTAIVQPAESSIPNQLEGMDVGPDGSIYVSSPRPGDRISKYDPSFHEVRKLYGSIGWEADNTYGDVNRISVDSTGAVWTRHSGSPWTMSITKYEADQFTTELSIPAFGATASQLEPWIADPSPYAADPLLPGEPQLFDVDVTTDDLYVNRGNRIDTYSHGTAEEQAYDDAPSFGEGTLANSHAIVVTADHHVYASTEGASGKKIVIFGPGDVLPNVHTYPADLEEVGHTDATVHGRLETAGGDPITECFVEYGPTTEYSGPESGTAACSPDPSGSSFTETTEVSAQLTGLTTGQSYHYRFVAGNGHGTNGGIDRMVIPAFVLNVKTLPPEDVNTSGATLKGSFDADGMATSYRFEYGISSSYDQATAWTAGGSAGGNTVVGQAIEGLPSGRVFHYRIVAQNVNGTTYGPDIAFRTGSTPDVSGVRTTEVGPDSAVLHARINPVGYDTTYYFEYGATPAYGQKVPISPADIGAGTDPVEISESVEGLQYGVTYHYRAVAENKWGITASGDTTFDYTPPSCPNDHVRQQTGSSFLPDCRAYELVSPGAAGAVLLYPTFAAMHQSGALAPFYELAEWPVNRGFASSPSRFAYFGGVGSVSGLYAPNSVIDMYMATRTNTGWVTTLPGMTGAEAFETARKECSDAMDLCTDHPETDYMGFHREFAPYLFTADGQKLGQLPTNLAVIPEGRKFHGQQRMSARFNHFVFGSASYESFSTWPPSWVPAIPFAPGGVSSGMGSLYDNDIAAKTVTIVSRDPAGNDLPEEWPTNAGIRIPGLSPDGSHILMQTPGANGRWNLFMRINDAVTYDVTEGAGVTPIGMTRSGSKVYFTTSANLSDADTDSSDDLYAWSEATGQVTLVSQGAGNGDSDECVAGWNSGGCGVEPLQPEYAHPFGNQNVSTSNAMDDVMAEGSGDVYFYSPELLDPDRHGIRNQRNLYVFHGGAVHLVATLDPGTEINRMQISPDGSHAAFVTAARLTPYDNHGFREMYTYEADSGTIRCASCKPDGTPPSGDVVASQGGRFMSDDGRTFFTSQDPLVPQDKNGKILDVYEYVGGRPQLITSGLGSRDFTGGSETLSLLLPATHTGLEAVSHNGTDVYFSTFETLVDEDYNGEFVKFYDARTDGGFANDPQPAPCAAADECHGTGSTAPAPRVNATAADLGERGNVVSRKARRHKRRHHHQKHPKKSHRRHRMSSHG